MAKAITLFGRFEGEPLAANRRVVFNTNHIRFIDPGESVMVLMDNARFTLLTNCADRNDPDEANRNWTVISMWGN